MFLGITVHAGSNWHPKFTLPQNIQRRASAQVTTARVTLIIVLASLVVCGIFCCVVLGFIWRKKNQRKKRDRNIADARAESQPFVSHQYNAVGNVDATMKTSQGYVQELPDDHQAYQMSSYTQKNELDGYVARVGLSQHMCRMTTDYL